MKKLLFLLLMMPAVSTAQTSRIATLQAARNLAVTDGQKRVFRLVTNSDGGSVKLYPKDGSLIAGKDTFNLESVTMRLQSLTRFALDEDSTAFAGKYAVNHGLLAFRRSLAKDQWNSITVPFSLTGRQVLDTFGDGTQLAVYQSVTDGDTPTVEFQTVALDTDDVVLEAGVHYIIKPTREPDIDANGETTVIYGSAKVKGPLYAIANVSMESGQVVPKNAALRSESNQVRLRLRGTYYAQNVSVVSSPRYMLGDQSLFYQLTEPVTRPGFSSWIEDASQGDRQPLHFYVNGVGEDLTMTTGIGGVCLDRNDSNLIFDLQGRRVTSPARGMYIIGGKKAIIK